MATTGADRPPLFTALKTAGITRDTAAERIGREVGSLNRWCDKGNKGPKNQGDRIALARLVMPNTPLLDALHHLWPHRPYESSNARVFPTFNAIPGHEWSAMIDRCETVLRVSAGTLLHWGEQRSQIGRAFQIKTEAAELADRTPPQVQIMCADPTGSAAAERDANESEPPDSTLPPGSLPARIETGLRVLYKQFADVESAEIRVNPPNVWPNVAMFQIDSVVVFYPYLYGVRGIDTPAFLIDMATDPAAASGFAEQFELLWGQSTTFTNGDSG